MMVSAAQVTNFLLSNWDALGTSGPKPSSFSYILITKGREQVGKLVLLAFSAERPVPRFAIKLARSKDQDSALEAEYRNLRMVAPYGTCGRVLTPEPLLLAEEEGSLLLVESVIDGIEVSHTGGARLDAFVAPIVDWLIHLAQATAGLLPNGNRAERLSELLERAGARAVTDDERRVLGEVSGRILALDAMRLPRVFEQRDMGTWNLMVGRDGRIGVLDWESSRACGFAGWDLFYFLAHYGFMVNRAKDLQECVRSFQETFWGLHGFAGIARAAMRRYAGATGVDEESLGALAAGCWLHHAMSEVSRLGIRLSASLFWHMLTVTLDRDCRLSGST